MNTAAQSDCFRNYWLLLILRASTLLLHSIQILQDMIKHSFRPTLFLLLLLLTGSSLPGQNAAQGIDYPAFLEKLAAENLSFAAEKYNISCPTRNSVLLAITIRNNDWAWAMVLKQS